jgi:hypothetical protein
LVIEIIVAVVCIVYFLINRRVSYKQTVGPLTLTSGETRSIEFDLGRRGAVTVTMDSIVPDWTGLRQKHAERTTAGNGNTPEIWLKICGVSEDAVCHKEGVQSKMVADSVHKLSRV